MTVEQDDFGYRIRTPDDWWALVTEHRSDVKALVMKYVDHDSYRNHRMGDGRREGEIFSPGACWVERLLSSDFDEAVDKRDYPALRFVLGRAWMGAPSNIPDGSDGYGRGWNVLCDLCSEDGVFDGEDEMAKAVALLLEGTKGMFGDLMDRIPSEDEVAAAAAKCSERLLGDMESEGLVAAGWKVGVTEDNEVRVSYSYTPKGWERKKNIESERG